MKHPIGPAESTAGYLAGSVPCLPRHEYFRLSRHAVSECPGTRRGLVRQTRQSCVPAAWQVVCACVLSAPGAAATGQPVRGPLAPRSPAAPPRVDPWGRPLSVGGSAPRQEFPALCEMGSGCLNTLLPSSQNGAAGKTIYPSGALPNRATPLLQLIYLWRRSLYFGACIWIFRTCLKPNWPVGGL